MIKADKYLAKLYPEKLINPASVDLTLGPEAIIFDWPLHYRLLWWLTQNPRWAKRRRNVNLITGYWLKPGEMALLHSQEPVHIPVDTAAILTLKSSRGREGLDHALAGWFDPGFTGEAVFEVYAHAHPVLLKAGMRFAQLIYMQSEVPEHPYNGHYQNQKGPTESWADGLRPDCIST